MSGTFDEQLWLDMAIAVSTEARALNNKEQGRDVFIYPGGGLTYFSPDINIFRYAFRPRAPTRTCVTTVPAQGSPEVAGALCRGRKLPHVLA